MLAALILCSTCHSDTLPENFTGQWTEHYENGNRKSQVQYVNGQPSGRSMLWWESGCPMSVHYFKDGILHGPMIKWEECMDIVAIGEYRDGEPWEGFFLVTPSTANPILDTRVQGRMLPYYVARYTGGLPYTTLSDSMLKEQLDKNPKFSEILRSIEFEATQ